MTLCVTKGKKHAKWGSYPEGKKSSLINGLELVKKNLEIFYNLPVCTSNKNGQKWKYVKFHFYDNKIPLNMGCLM